jgi:transcription initiation factor TFIIIB Brf1 subunit/transcription initiation factor TFIIB
MNSFLCSHRHIGISWQPKLCSLLRLPMEVQNAAVEMCPSILRLQEGKDPGTIASTALYVASRLHHTERRQIDGTILRRQSLVKLS